MHINNLYLTSAILLAFVVGSSHSLITCSSPSFALQKSTSDLVCSSCCNTSPGATATIPSPSSRNTNGPPTDASKVLTFYLDKVTGTYQAGGFTELGLYVDADLPFLAMAAQVSYDWTSDGTWDRVELYDVFFTNIFHGTWQLWKTTGSDASVGLVGGLKKAASGPFSNLKGGRVRLQLWAAFGFGRMYVKTDASSPNLSLFKMPFTGISIDDGVSSTVVVTPATTAPVTSAPVTSAPETSAPETTSPPVIVPTTTCADQVFSLKSNCRCLVCNQCCNQAPASVMMVADSENAKNVGEFPNSEDKILTFSMTNITATLISGQNTSFTVYVDGNSSSLALSASVSYDWTGDGIFDRYEFYNIFTTNNLAGYEAYTGNGNYYYAPVTPLANLVRGTVRLQLWSAYAKSGTFNVLTDSQSSGQMSFLKVPHTVSSWTFPTQC